MRTEKHKSERRVWTAVSIIAAALTIMTAVPALSAETIDLTFVQGERDV